MDVIVHTEMASISQSIEIVRSTLFHALFPCAETLPDPNTALQKVTLVMPPVSHFHHFVSRPKRQVSRDYLIGNTARFRRIVGYLQNETILVLSLDQWLPNLANHRHS